MSMNINWVMLDEIHPYENNPRHNDDAVQYVANSIKEFGWKQPIVVDKDGVIIAGHTRYKAAQKLGLEKVPVITADDLTEEQVKAYRLADNKTGEFAQWDLGLLGQELGDIMDLDMQEFGFFDDGVEEYDFSDFDQENEALSGEETNIIKISIPGKHMDTVKEWLANGERETAVGMGIGVMRRCGLL